MAQFGRVRSGARDFQNKFTSLGSQAKLTGPGSDEVRALIKERETRRENRNATVFGQREFDRVLGQGGTLKGAIQTQLARRRGTAGFQATANIDPITGNDLTDFIDDNARLQAIQRLMRGQR